MAWLTCPKCTHTFRSAPYRVQVCPACGYRSLTDSSRLPPAPEEATVGEGAVTVPIVEGVIGKPRRFLGYVFLSLFTVGIYSLVWFWRLFAELDRQHGQKPAKTWYAWHCLFFGALYLVPAFDLIMEHWIEPKQDFFFNDLGIATELGIAVTLFLAAGVCWMVYVAIELPRVHGYRRAHGLKPGIGVWSIGFLALPLLPAIAVPLYTYLPNILEFTLPLFTDWEVGDALPTWVKFLRFGGALMVFPLVAFYLLNRTVQRLWYAIYTEMGAQLPEWAAAAKARSDGPGAPA